MIKRNYKVYILKDPFSFETKYVGVTLNIQARLQAHRTDRRNNKEKGQWIDSLIKQNKFPIVEIIFQSRQGRLAFAYEKRLIKKLRRDGYKLFNKADGGQVNAGFKLTNITKQQMSLMRTGKSNSFYGKHHSKETRRKIGESCSIPVIDQNGIKYNSMSDAARKLNLHVPMIRRVLIGTQKQTGGYKFIYA